MSCSIEEFDEDELEVARIMVEDLPKLRKIPVISLAFRRETKPKPSIDDCLIADDPSLYQQLRTYKNSKVSKIKAEERQTTSHNHSEKTEKLRFRDQRRSEIRYDNKERKIEDEIKENHPRSLSSSKRNEGKPFKYYLQNEAAFWKKKNQQLVECIGKVKNYLEKQKALNFQLKLHLGKEKMKAE